MYWISLNTVIESIKCFKNWKVNKNLTKLVKKINDVYVILNLAVIFSFFIREKSYRGDFFEK